MCVLRVQRINLCHIDLTHFNCSESVWSLCVLGPYFIDRIFSGIWVCYDLLRERERVEGNVLHGLWVVIWLILYDFLLKMAFINGQVNACVWQTGIFCLFVNIFIIWFGRRKIYLFFLVFSRFFFSLYIWDNLIPSVLMHFGDIYFERVRVWRISLSLSLSHTSSSHRIGSISILLRFDRIFSSFWFIRFR